MLHIVPEPHRDAIATALTRTFGGQPLDALTLIKGGLSSALVYRAVVAGAPYLVRIATRTAAINDPVRHHACLRVAAEAGIAPRVHYTDDASATLIADFIAAQPFHTCPRPALLDGLARIIARMQATPAFPLTMPYADGVDGLVAELRASEMVAAPDVFARYAELSAGYPRDRAAHVSAHNDLNPGNILWDGARLWLVDWEVACGNDPYADRASVCNDFIVTPDDEHRLITGYFGAAPSPYQVARLWLMRQVCWMMRTTLFFRIVRAQRPELRLTAHDLAAPVPTPSELRGQLAQLVLTPDGQLTYARSVLAQLDANLRSPQLADALRLVRAG